MSRQHPLPAAEVAYRDLVADFPEFFEVVQQARRWYEKGKYSRWPYHPLVPYPVGLVQEALISGHQFGKRVPGPPPGTSMFFPFAAHLASLLNYGTTRQTYVVTPELWEGMKDLPWPDEAPSEVLMHLPLRAFAVETPDEFTWMVSYDLATGREREGLVELRLGPLPLAGVLPYLLEGRLSDSLKAFEANVRKAFSETALPSESLGILSAPLKRAPIINVLLYLGNARDVEHRSASKGIYKRHRQHELVLREARRGYKLDEVGVRYAAAWQAFRRIREQASGPPTGRTVKPHVRRAHWHLYWTGPGRTVPRLRFVDNVLVHGGADLPATIQKVKGRGDERGGRGDERGGHELG